MSAALTNHMLTQIAFKRLSGKAMTSGLLSLPGETLGSTVQSSATTIFGQVVPNAPVSSSAQLFQIQSASEGQPGTVQQVEFDLVRVVGTKYDNFNGVDIEALDQDDGGTQAANTIAPRQGFGAALGNREGSFNTFHAYTIKLPAAYVASCSAADFATHASTTKVPGSDAPFTNGFMSTGSVQMQVVPEYLSTVIGTTNAYIPEVIATDGSVMNSTDNIDYYFDAMAGVLFVQDPSGSNNAIPENPPINSSQPGKVRGFLYVGQYQSEVVSGDTVSLHFSASEGTGFTFANNATASFTSGSGGGLTVTAGATNNIEFALVDVVSGSEQVQDNLSGVSLFRISSSTGTSDIDLQFGQTASFVDGGAGLTVKATGNTTKTVEIGAASDSVTFKDLTITETASISYLKVTFETASQLLSSGSTIFGNTMDDFHNFTGSVHFSSSEFSWDEPVGNSSQAPLVYDALTGLIHTGSNYALSADGMTQFQISGSNFIGGSTTQNGNFAITEGNTITFAVSGGLEVTASAGDILTINATGLSASIATDIANATSSITTLTNASASFATDIINATASISILTTASSSFATDIINATASILVNETAITNATASITNLVASASEGFLLRGGTGAAYSNGGNVLPFGTASFVGSNGISIAPAGAGSTQLNVIFGGTDVPSPLFISASGTGDATGSTSLAYGASASFAANGGGLEVTESSGQITYTLNPGTVSASAVFVSNNENTPGDRAIIFAADVSNTDRYTQLESDESVFRYNPGLNGGTFTYNATAAVTMDGSQITPTATTFNFATNANTDTLNIGNADGGQTVNILGSASIEGDLTVKGTTTSIRTTNLEVEDQFILLVSRSTAENLDGGIIIQTGKDSATAIGTALFYDDSESRWGLTKADDTAFNATSATPRQYVVSVSSSNAEPPTLPTDFGNNAVSRYGMMYVDTSDSAGDGNTIWIYAE